MDRVVKHFWRTPLEQVLLHFSITCQLKSQKVKWQIFYSSTSQTMTNQNKQNGLKSTNYNPLKKIRFLRSLLGWPT